MKTKRNDMGMKTEDVKETKLIYYYLGSTRDSVSL
jgi:hypothetical protein